VRKIGIEFTPHVGRHSVGTRLNESGAGLKMIMAALDHRDPESSIRYQAANIEVVTAAAARLVSMPVGDRRCVRQSLG